MSKVEARVLEMVGAVALRDVDLDEPLLDSGLLDSIAAVDLALMLEAEFDVDIPAQRIHEYMQTARTLALYIESNR